MSPDAEGLWVDHTGKGAALPGHGARRPQTAPVYRGQGHRPNHARTTRGRRGDRVTGGARGSGRQDSNLRSPAPKAGALATTLRPAKRAPTPLCGAVAACLERMTGIEPA